MIFEVNGLKLTGNYKKGDYGNQPVFIIHGGGLRRDQASRFLEWQNILADNGFGSFVFNHSGILPSEGNVGNTTLELRLKEARIALATILGLSAPKSQNVVVMGVSMGGHIAAQLATEIKAHGLILCEPGSFIESAEDKPFGPLFSKELRREQNWDMVKTRSFDSIKDYTGNLLVVAAENDTVVPKEIPKRYFSEAQQTRTREIYSLKNATHFYFRTNDSAVNPEWRKDFYKKTISWLQGIT